TYSGEPVKKYRDGIAYYQITSYHFIPLDRFEAEVGKDECYGNSHDGEDGDKGSQLRIGFIRRIIVDNAVSDRNGKNRTRIHFELNCPAVIRRGFVPDCEKSTLKNVKHERWLTIRRGCNPVEQPHPLAFADSPVFSIEFSDVPSDATIYAILSRLRVRSDLSIEFASYEACIFALERVITMIDERKRIGSIMIAFTKEYEVARGYSGKADLSLDEIREGYRRVRKIVATQTRVIYVVPETMMANRVLRRYDFDGTRVIRVTFRDDDNQTMRTSKTSKALIERTLGNFLRNGVHVA
ncbi:hypothetical protein TELCIR_13863, partial [Teladorsagia circumcincta]